MVLTPEPQVPGMEKLPPKDQSLCGSSPGGSGDLQADPIQMGAVGAQPPAGLSLAVFLEKDSSAGEGKGSGSQRRSVLSGPHLEGAAQHVRVRAPCLPIPEQSPPRLGSLLRHDVGDQQFERGRRGLRRGGLPSRRQHTPRKSQGLPPDTSVHGAPPRAERARHRGTDLFGSIPGNCVKNPHTGQG